MVLAGHLGIGILAAAFRYIVHVLVARDLAAVAAFVDHDEFVGLPDGLQMHRGGQVLLPGFEVLEGQHPEPVQHPLILAGPAEPVAVVGVPKAPALIPAADLPVDVLEPLVALPGDILLGPGHDPQDVLGPQYRTHPEPAGKAELVLAAHQLLLGRPGDAGVPHGLPVLAGRPDHREVRRKGAGSGIVEALVQAGEALRRPRSDHLDGRRLQRHLGAFGPLLDQQDLRLVSRPDQNQIPYSGGHQLPPEAAAHGRPDRHGHAPGRAFQRGIAREVDPQPGHECGPGQAAGVDHQRAVRRKGIGDVVPGDDLERAADPAEKVHIVLGRQLLALYHFAPGNIEQQTGEAEVGHLPGVLHSGLQHGISFLSLVSHRLVQLDMAHK